MYNITVHKVNGNYLGEPLEIVICCTSLIRTVLICLHPNIAFFSSIYSIWFLVLFIFRGHLSETF